MKNIIGFILSLLVSFSAFAQTPPQIVYNPNGTVSLVGNTATPYVIDPNIKFRVTTTCNNSNALWNGTKQNGTSVYMDSVVEVDVNLVPLPSAIVTTGAYQVWKSADVVLTFDPTKFQYIDAIPNSFKTDTTVIDTTKITGQLLRPGVVKLHSEVVTAPENRTPAKPALYYQFNFGGFLWQSSMRNIGKVRLKTISNFYYPTQIPTDILISNTETTISGGINSSTNLFGESQNNANKILCGPSPAYKVSLSLVGPTTQVKSGDDITVKIVGKPETLPQSISFVSTLFVWDNTKLEFMGIDKTGAKASMMSSIDMVSPTAVNEIAIPKDGNAHHNWLCVLGDKTPVNTEFLVVTLKFKVLTDFTETTVEIVKKTDPRLVGLSILDDTGIGSVMGTTNNAVIKGIK